MTTLRNFSCLDAPAHISYIPDTGNQRDDVFNGSVQFGEVRLADLSNIIDLISPGAQLRGVGDLVASLQSMDLPEVVRDTPVVAGNPNISIPAGGGLEVAGALGQALQALILINLDAEAQFGDIQLAQTAIRENAIGISAAFNAAYKFLRPSTRQLQR